MAVLSELHKEQIVRQLACFRRPAEVVAYMKDEFELDLTVQQVRTYDPTNPRFEADRDKWEPIFLAARETYINDVKAVPAAGQAYRLNALQEGINDARKKKNWKLVAELCEQVAKEVGGALTNERNVNVNNVRTMSAEDRASLLGSIIGEAIDKRKAADAAKPTIN